MKRIVSILCLSLFCFALPLAAQADNLVGNGDFEGGVPIQFTSGGTPATSPTGWFCKEAGPATTTAYSISSGVGIGGSAGLKGVAGPDAAGRTTMVNCRNEKLPIPDWAYIADVNYYTLSFWYKTTGGGWDFSNPDPQQSRAEAFVIQDNGAGGLYWDNSTWALDGTNGAWAFFTKTFPLKDTWDPSFSTEIFRFKFLVGLVPGAEFYADDVVLTPIPEPGSIAVLLSGVGGLLVIRRKRA